MITYTENLEEQERRNTITVANDFFEKEVVLIQLPKSSASFDQYFGNYDESASHHIKVYPNPAFGQLFVDYGGVGDWCAFLMDMSGKTRLSCCGTRKERKALSVA